MCLVNRFSKIQLADLTRVDPDSEALPLGGSVVATKAEVNFGVNYKRLQEIKKKYDPELVFNKWFVIQPSA